jgi:uncharacterized protein (DUF3084 family)
LLPEEQVDALNEENATLKTRLSKLQMQHSKLEEDHAEQLDLLDATVSKHASEMEHIVTEWQARVVQAESAAVQELDQTHAENARAAEVSNKRIASLEGQIRQLEQQSTGRLVRGTASLEELTRENDALAETCATQASELSELHQRLSLVVEGRFATDF